jgi:hypothetical protein
VHVFAKAPAKPPAKNTAVVFPITFTTIPSRLFFNILASGIFTGFSSFFSFEEELEDLAAHN